jgi:hypothetical protein
MSIPGGQTHGGDHQKTSLFVLHFWFGWVLLAVSTMTPAVGIKHTEAFIPLGLFVPFFLRCCSSSSIFSNFFVFETVPILDLPAPIDDS